MSCLYVMWKYPQLSQTFVRNEIQGLRKLGIDVDVISLEPSGESNPDAGEYEDLGRPGVLRAVLDHLWWLTRRPSRYVAFLRTVNDVGERWKHALRRLPSAARQQLRSGPPSRLHTHFVWATAADVVYLGALLDVPASITVHAKDIYVTPASRLRKRFRHFDRVVTISNYNAGLLAGVGVGDVGEGAEVVPCGVDVPAASDARPENEVDVVSVGRLIDKKGFDTLLRALAIVRKDRPELRARILGDGPEREALEQLRAELGLEDAVDFAGPRSHTETLSHIASARIFCLAAQRAEDGDVDGMPVVIREAMARAVPVVSTTVTGIPESVDEDVGWLVPPRDPAALAEAILEALLDDDGRRRRGEAGRERVVQRWTLEEQARSMARLLDL